MIYTYLTGIYIMCNMLQSMFEIFIAHRYVCVCYNYVAVNVWKSIPHRYLYVCVICCSQSVEFYTSQVSMCS
jgi:hypothetical protein